MNNRLSDQCWNSEMSEVQLWENDWFGGMFFPSFLFFFFLLAC